MKLLKNVTFAAALWMSSCMAPKVDQPYPQTPTEVRVEDNSRPSYLRSLPSSEELSRMSDVERVVEEYVQATLDQNNPNPRVFFSNGSVKRQVNINGTNVMVELPFFRYGNGNRINNIIDRQNDDADAVFNDFSRLLSRANNITMERFARIDLNANRRIRQRMGNVQENAPVQGLEGITLGHLVGMQHHTNADLLPKRFILAPLRDALAITRLHEDVIIYSPISRRIDEIWGQPSVASHELWHVSQSLMDAIGTNVELYAHGVDLELQKEDPLSFLAHPYGDSMRELALEYYGFDSDKVLQQLINNRLAAIIELDETVLNNNSQQTSRLSEIFAERLHEETEPEFRSFSPYWAMMQTYYRDENLLLRLATLREREPVAMTVSERRQFARQHSAQIETIIKQATDEYEMPAVMSFFGFRFIQGTTISSLVHQKCVAAGFNEKQSEYVFHLFLKQTFFNSDGSYNYGNIPIKDAMDAMNSLMSDLDISDRDMDRYFPNSKNEVRQDLAIYNWHLNRLRAANNYLSIAEREGLNPPKNFFPEIFDPRTNLELAYNIMPEYTRHADESSMRRELRRRLGSDEYLIRSYDISGQIGFNNGVDYISAFRIKSNGQPESRPCVVLFAGGGSNVPNYALFDAQKEGQNGNGVYERIEDVGEHVTIDSLLDKLVNVPVTHVPIITPPAPEPGLFEAPFDYRSWNSIMSEYDSDMDNKIDAVAINYHNGRNSITELYRLPEGYEGGIAVDGGILLNRGLLLEFMPNSSLGAPYAVQFSENGHMTTLFDNDGNGNFRRRLR